MAFERKKRSPEEEMYIEKLININRVAKVIKGGKNLSFSALIAVGDGAGTVGLGFGKAREVADAIRKATEDAKRNFKAYPLIDGRTIPHQVIGRFGAARVFMKPASPGTGVIAGGAVRAILEAMGIKDVLTKNMGTANAINMAKATIAGLDDMEDINMAAARRGIPVEKLKR